MFLIDAMRELDLMENDRLFNACYQVAKALRAYHRHKVVGLENIPSEGAAMIVLSHSLATYDTLCFGATVYADKHRMIRALTDRRIFQTPGLAQIFKALGSEIGSHEAGERILREGHLLGLSPGGMRESLRPSSKKHQIDWRGRLGFVRLAIRAGAPVILVACPAADDIYSVYNNPLTPWVYEHLKWPLPIFRGIGLSFIPRPVKLIHYVSKPMLPPKVTESTIESATVEFHAELSHEMQKLLKK